MTYSKQAIGILGGTFDPIHLGHLRMALELQESLDLSRVHIVPCYQPVHRKMPIATPEERLAMITCAVANEPVLYADDREIKRKTPSYSIDTVLEIRETYPNIPLAFIIGIDAFLSFPSWDRWEDILVQSHLIVAYRPNYQLPTSGIIADIMRAHLKDDISFIHEHVGGGILLRPITALEISATDIRKQIAMGRNPRYLLPDSVYDYIKQKGIYRISQL